MKRCLSAAIAAATLFLPPAARGARVTVSETNGVMRIENGFVTVEACPASGTWRIGEGEWNHVAGNGRTNADWMLVTRRGNPVKTIWLGAWEPQDGTYRATGLSLSPDGGTPQILTLGTNAMETARQHVREAYALRKEKKYSFASKKLRQAAALNPLDAWNLAERAFLEDDGEGAVQAACMNRGCPSATLRHIVEAYRGIGATNEVSELRRQAASIGMAVDF